MSKLHLPHAHSTLAVAALLALAACGGSSSDGTVVDPTVTQLAGVVVAGQPLASATVDVRCASGSASATTAADGSYTINVGTATLPCIVRAGTGGNTVFSVTSTTAATQTVNVTRLTQLIVAGAADRPAAAAFDNAASVAATLTPAAVETATTEVRTALAGAVTVPTTVSPIASPLTLPGGSAAASDNGQATAALNTTIATGGTTVAALETAVAAVSPAPGTPAATAVATVSLPPAQQLQPAAANCAGLRSGRYRTFTPSDVGNQTGVISINATTLVISYPDNTTDTLTAAGPCRYNIGADAQLAFSQAGVGIATGRDTASTPYRATVLFPEQTIAVSDLAGDWNDIVFDRFSTTGNYIGQTGQVSINASGAITASAGCTDLAACVPNPAPFPSLIADSSGGFRATGGGVTAADGIRFFAYRAGSGDLAMFYLEANGAFAMSTKQRIRSVPTLNSDNSNWNVSVALNGTTPATLSENRNTITSVDTAAGTWVRTNLVDGHTEPFVANVPRSGYNRRTGGSSANNTGGTTTYSDSIFLQLTGLGLSAGIRNAATTTNGSFNLSVAQPAP